MTRILFLGAGASLAAGYPLTSHLLSSLEADAVNSPFDPYRDAWDTWKTYRNEAPPWLRLVLDNPNPEVALTLPDLFDLAVEAQDEHRVVTAIQRLDKDGVDSHVELERYFDGDERKALSMARLARVHLVDALHWYFLFKHFRDREIPKSLRDYIRKQLACMSTGDVVLTTNWDPLCERTLAEDMRWGPANGYGFSRILLEEVGGKRQPLPASCETMTEVRVLKLHGCFGWRMVGNTFFLQGADFLDGFGFYCGGSPIQIRDQAESEFYSPSAPLVAFPSYIKPLTDPVVSEVWREASLTVAQCTEFVAAGYSFPASDSAIRALLLPIASGVRSGRIRAAIVDPSETTLNRWQQFLGPNATCHCQKFEEAPALFET